MTPATGPLPPAAVSFEERDGVPTWIVAGQHGGMLIEVLEGRVNVRAGPRRLDGPELRALLVALQSAYAQAWPDGEQA